jgi:hypothetical protein
MRDRNRYVISLTASVLVFAAVNFRHLFRHVICDDCFFSYGLPFVFFSEGGFVGGGFRLIGTTLDALLVLAFGVSLAMAWKRIVRTKQGSSDDTIA